jgi:hypothetical protein
MVTRIWHGVIPVSKSDEYLNLMRTVAIPKLPCDARRQRGLRDAPHGGRDSPSSEGEFSKR